MQNLIHRTLLLTISTLALAGCQYDRSFMQMDSNSGAPFLGLQWSVDSGSRPSDSKRVENTDYEASPIQTVSTHSALTTTRHKIGSVFQIRRDDADIEAVNIRLAEF